MFVTRVLWFQTPVYSTCDLRLSRIMAGMNTPYVNPSLAQFKAITQLVSMNPEIVWSSEKEPNMFVAGLEGLLEASPVLHAHWTGLFYHMVPGDYELERMWIKTNIMTPALSWNAAKSAFIGHFQRGDFMDGQRYLYNDCHQTQHESIQQYSRRFQILATQLGYADNDLQSIYRYIGGLPKNTQQSLYSHKVQQRTVRGNPAWDFTSLTTTIGLAILCGTSPIVQHHDSSVSSVPLHLRSSALANPTTGPITSHSTASRKRKAETLQQQPVATTDDLSGTKCYRCQNYGHFAHSCPTKVKRSRRTRMKRETPQVTAPTATTTSS